MLTKKDMIDQEKAVMEQKYKFKKMLQLIILWDIE